MNRLLLFAQFRWYLVVGGTSFFVDIWSFVALTTFDVPVLAASATSFIVATLVNYYLCYKLAFIRGRFTRLDEVARLFAVAIVGLGLNTLFVWLFIAAVAFPPVAAKIAAVPLVVGWNFLGRRIFVFHAEIPVASFLFAQALASTLSRKREKG